MTKAEPFDGAVTDPPIVGIGASAGGVKALQEFFESVPERTGAAFVVIVHLDPGSRSELAAILANRTKMPVHQVDDSVHLQPNNVYVIAPNRRLSIADHSISALPFIEPRGQRAPIDLFFRSLAEHHSEAIAVILTGAGGDGAIGVRAVKESGGIVLVQDPREAEYASMPRSAIATEMADFVLPVHELAARVAELIGSRGRITPEPRDSDEDVLRKILAHVRVRTGHDFMHYKRATVQRRIACRAQVTRKASLADYYTYLRENVEEAQSLFSDFLISVTMFFRDPRAFEQLSQLVIPRLFEEKETGDTIRIWVPGCATGEETYTIGMLLLEEAAKREVRPALQIFGSDLDAGALAIAREGHYPVAIEADLSEERLHRFFHKEGDHYRVRRELRDIVLFASHSLLRDPPFSRLDMISCRNLLIYLDRDLQQQACHTFHYALRPGGFLFLGPSEMADQPPGLFRQVDRDARIYRAVANASERRLPLPVLLGPNYAAERPQVVARASAPPGSVSDAILHRHVLEKLAPPSMLVSEAHHVIHLSDNAGRYLQPSGGPLTADAIDMVRQELRFDLRAALHRSFDRGEATLSVPIRVQFNGAQHRVYMQVKPAPQEGEAPRHAVVMFIEGEEVGDVLGSDEAQGTIGPANETIRQLREELQLALGRLRTTREELESANEELRAANEELQSINEEYRSTSEELETSKEELQSINEELQTVNSELMLKLESVSRAHGDLQNLMSATDVATLFLDPSLHIKRFTPRLSEIFNVTAADEGRPITDFTHLLDYDKLAEDAAAVLKNLTPIEREARSRDDGWYLVRIRPYRTMEDRIDGVVATFLDITDRRRAEGALRASEARLRQETRLVELSRSPIFVWDFDGPIVEWNRGSEELYGYTREEAVGQRKEALLRTNVPGASFAVVRQALEEHGTWKGELQHSTKDGQVLTVETRIELIAASDRRLCLESTFNITDRKRWEKRQQLLLGELMHRVKNTLAVVQSVARQTLRTTATPKEFVTSFEGRLSALATAHKLLVDSHWEGADIAALTREQLAPYTSSNPDRLRIEGEPAIVPAEIATPFGLVLHELATNAAKYGAFSAPKGRVLLSWTLSGNQPRHLAVRWEEQGGPVVSPPQKRGFGGTLIESGLPGATVRREFAPSGVVCTLELDLPEAMRNGDGDDGD